MTDHDILAVIAATKTVTVSTTSLSQSAAIKTQIDIR